MPKVIVLGFMGRIPIAGVIWQHLHYLIGLQRLGCDVWYVEDTSICPYNPWTLTVTDQDGPIIAFLGDIARRFGFEGRWVYRARYKDPYVLSGCNELQYKQLLLDADCALNICGNHELNEDLAVLRQHLYIESDPGVEQVRIDNGDRQHRDFLAGFSHRFSFGEAIGTQAFPVPLHGLEWLPTRQPIVVDLWADQQSTDPGMPAGLFSSICNWSTAGTKDIEWRGSTYLWSKSLEFLRFVDAPQRSGAAFELVTDIPDPAQQQLFRNHGWSLRLPYELSADWSAYRAYIASSLAEFTCAKDQYIRLKTGWFSDRSACYLAAGRPVITQETGFSNHYGHGEGLLPFTTMEQLCEAVASVQLDYERHSRAALEIAREFFEATTVLRSLLQRAGVL